MMQRAAVLTISDRCSRGEAEDRSGPAVIERLSVGGWTVPIHEVLPDEAGKIAHRLAGLVDSGEVDAIFTTGGTGVAPRDVTPEATRAILDKEIPGLAERMRAEGARHTPFASLSRALAGTRGSVLIVNLPGSPQGAVESLDAILDLAPHVIRLLHGDTGHEDAAKRPG
jgi:molybdopterin adenylyltransferase